jgi:hypothetical protein
MHGVNVGDVPAMSPGTISLERLKITARLS